MVPKRKRVAGVDYMDIPSGIDEKRLEKIYGGLVERGLPEDDIIVALNYMINESGGDPSRNDEYGKGLLDGIIYRDNMFIEDDEDTILGRQLDSIVTEIENGNIDTVKDIRSTDYGEALRDRIYGNVNPMDSRSVLRGGIGWKYSEGGELDERNSYYMWKGEEPGVKKYFKGSPYAAPAVERGEDGKERIVGMSDITSSVYGGTDQLLYDDDFMKEHTVYRGDDGRYIMVDNRVLPNLDDAGIGTRVSSEELKRTMPSMDYLGGSDYRYRVANLIPGLMDTIRDKAESYGINPNLVLHRLMKEGMIDNITREYNSLSAEDKKHYFTDGHLWDESYNGYGELGLDDAGQHLLDGRYELKDRNARWGTFEVDPVNERGRQLHNVPIAEDLNSALEMVTAEMAYRQGEMLRRGVPAGMIDTYTNAAFNAGLNSPILRDSALVQRRYSVPDYYGRVKTMAMGGNLYDGLQGPSQMQVGTMWDPDTLLQEIPEPVVVEQTQPTVAQRPRKYVAPAVPDKSHSVMYDPNGQLVLDLQPSQPSQPAPAVNDFGIKAVSMPAGFVAPQGITVERPVDVRQTLLRDATPIQRDNLTVTAPRGVEGMVYTPDLAYNEAVALGSSSEAALAEAMRNLPKSDEDIRSLQSMLLDNGYYDTSKFVPKITARTADEVKALQQMLVDNGYDLGKYGVDGKIGSFTRNAYAQYMKDHPDEALRQTIVDGKIGSATREAYRKFMLDVLRNSEPEPEIIEEATVQNGPVEESETTQPAEWLQKYIDKVGGIYKSVPRNYRFKDSKSNILRDSYYDKANLDNWEKAVKKASEDSNTEWYTNPEDGTSIPIVDYNWTVTNDQILRALRFLPNLTPEFSPNEFAKTSRNIRGQGYVDTWDSGNNEVDVSRFPITLGVSQILMGSKGRGLAETSLKTPGRGSIGGFLISTQPDGIYISDGYEFAAPLSKINTTENQTDEYNEERMSVQGRARAKNKRAHIYYVPWDVYNSLWNN